MRTFVLYTAARLAVLVAAFLLLYAAGARGLLLIVLAFGVSALVSYFLLAGMRDRFTAHVQERASRISAQLDAATRAEDVDDDEPASTPGEPDQLDR